MGDGEEREFTNGDGEREFTNCERRVFETITNPQYYRLVNGRKIEAAEVSKRQYYRIMAKPWFREQIKAWFLSTIRNDIGPVVKAAIDTAKIRGKEGQLDRKMLLEMSGLYEPPKQRSEATVTVNAHEAALEELA